jgi:hypothetical protein
MIQRIKDLILEVKIKQLNKRLINAPAGEMLKVWGELMSAINSRSGAQVKRMEKARGLCR